MERQEKTIGTKDILIRMLLIVAAFLLCISLFYLYELYLAQKGHIFLEDLQYMYGIIISLIPYLIVSVYFIIGGLQINRFSKCINGQGSKKAKIIIVCIAILLIGFFAASEISGIILRRYSELINNSVNSSGRIC